MILLSMILSDFEYEAGHSGNQMSTWMTSEALFKNMAVGWDQETISCLREQHIQVCGIAVGSLVAGVSPSTVLPLSLSSSLFHLLLVTCHCQSIPLHLVHLCALLLASPTVP